VTVISVVAGVIIGLFLGWCVTMVITRAAAVEKAETEGVNDTGQRR